MKAITLWQPWASLMQNGAKTVETRGWYTHYRGPLLICSAKGGLSKKELKETIANPVFQACLFGLHPDYMVPDNLHHAFTMPQIKPEHLLYGHALCVVDLVDVVPAESLVPQYELFLLHEAVFGDYSPGRFAWITKNRRAIEPFQVTGRQGFFNVPDEQINFITPNP